MKHGPCLLTNWENDPGCRNQVSEETSPYLLLGARNERQKPPPHGSGMSHATTATPKPFLRAPWRAGEKICWMDNVKEWTSLPMPELLTTPAEKTEGFCWILPRNPRRPNWSRDRTELTVETWPELVSKDDDMSHDSVMISTCTYTRFFRAPISQFSFFLPALIRELQCNMLSMCSGKSLHRVTRKFSQSCLWNRSSVEERKESQLTASVHNTQRDTTFQLAGVVQSAGR